MIVRQEVLDYGMTFPNVYIDTPFRDNNWVLLRHKENRKAFAWTYEWEGTIRVNVKVSLEWRDFWRNAYESVIPGYHQNKEHWNTIILDGTIPKKEIQRMIGESYDLTAPKKNNRKKQEECKMLFLEYPKCSTCQKAKKWLDNHQIDYIDRHIKEENPTAEELKAWHKLSGLPLKRFFNTSGLIYKNMGLKDKLPNMTEEEQYDLLATDGMLVKRPLVIGNDFALVGFKEAEWIEKLSEK